MLRWRLGRKAGAWPESVEITPAVPSARVDGRGLRVTHIGHAGVLLQHAGTNILFDPHYSEHASPVSFAGPKRIHEPGIRFSDLPPIQLVLISHNHYDHLDTATLRRLREAHDPLFLVPKGDGRVLRALKISRYKELGWWEHESLGVLNFRFVPAQHFSGRGLHDRMQSHWGAWVVESPHGNVYHGGDSAWGPHFQLAGERLGPFRLALLPIGAYEPRWFMQHSHIDPDEAVQAHLALRAARSWGIHWGSFKDLTDEPYDEPPLRLAKALKAAGVAAELFTPARPGQVLELE